MLKLPDPEHERTSSEHRPGHGYLVSMEIKIRSAVLGQEGGGGVSHTKALETSLFVPSFMLQAAVA